MNWPTLSLRGVRHCRLALAVLVLLDLLDRLRDWRAFYSDAGVLPRWEYYRLVDKPGSFCPGMFSDQALGHALVILSGLLALVGLALNRRWGNLATWLWLLSLHNRNPLLLDDADTLLRMTLFWSLFLPTHGAEEPVGVTGPACFTFMAGWASSLWFATHYQVMALYPPGLRGLAYVSLVLAPILLFIPRARRAAVLWLAIWLALSAPFVGWRFILVAAAALPAFWPAKAVSQELPLWTQLSALAFLYATAWALTDVPTSPVALGKETAWPGQLLHLDARWNKIPPFPGDGRIRFEARVPQERGASHVVAWPADPPASYRWMRYYSYLATEPRFLEPFAVYLTPPGGTRPQIYQIDAADGSGRQVY